MKPNITDYILLFYLFISDGGIEPPRRRAYETREPQPVLQSEVHD